MERVKLMPGVIPDARNRKAPAPAGSAHDSTEEGAHRTSSIPIKPTSAESSDKTTLKKSEVATHTKGQDTRNPSSRTRPLRHYRSIQEKLRETRRKILQGVKGRLDQLGIALKLGKKVRRNRPLAVRIRTHVSGRTKRPSPEKVPAPSVLGLSSADKLTALPREAGHPRVNNRQPLAQYQQQQTVRVTHPMDTKRSSTATHPGQVKSTTSGAIDTPLRPSKLEGDPNSSEAKRDTIRGSADSYQGLGYAPAATDHATPAARKQTLRMDGTEEVANRVALPPKPPIHPRWKVTFKMAIHLATGEDAFRLTYVDTGSSVNIISIDVVESLGLAKEPYQGPRLKPSGGSYLPQWQVTFNWNVVKRSKTYTTTFAVLDKEHSADFDILLGRETIEENKFYMVNEDVWFHPTNERVLPSIEVDT
ncbi:MAG: hypothetical protein LQ339_007855 [Xanthoria mediterranea]|nr:MAG: hypothetical protein LQ339_007855 [Xanthoria mediterranea]